MIFKPLSANPKKWSKSQNDKAFADELFERVWPGLYLLIKKMINYVWNIIDSFSLLPMYSEISESIICKIMFTYLLKIIWFLKTSQELDLAIFVLTHFSPVSHFYTPWKRGIEMWHWTKMG